MVENNSQLMGPGVPLPYKNSTWIMSFSSQTVYKEAAEGQTRGQTMGGSYSTSKNFFFRETPWGLEEEAEQAPPPSLALWEVELPVDFQHFGSDQESLTSLKATNPAGHRQPGSRKQQSLTHWCYWTLTPCSLGWGTERLQNMETVLPAQVCAKSHTPDDHRTGEGMLHFNISKRHCSFPRSSLSCTHNTSKAHLFSSPQKMLFNANPDELQIQ